MTTAKNERSAPRPGQGHGRAQGSRYSPHTKQVAGAGPATAISIGCMTARQLIALLKAGASVCIGPTREEYTLARLRADAVFIALLERARAEETESDVVFDFLRISHWLGYSAHHVQDILDIDLSASSTLDAPTVEVVLTRHGLRKCITLVGLQLLPPPLVVWPAVPQSAA
jgi:hypothetical protein